ncbi:MAG TPA: FGGY-family carbohydrate kinase [Candidatus Lokiarchaeia archaeon]|nr:FGGY-family carbohydrate kinase [Candidatus Lokiarchaeia archaeon]
MADLLIGTDIGTTGTKSVLADTTGKILADAYEEYPIVTPRPLWAEFPISRPLKAAFSSIQTVIKKSKVNPKDIAGVCISGLYGGSGVPVDENMKEVRPCLPWLDQRAINQCEWVRHNVGEDRINEITGNCIHPYWGFTKMLWIQQEEPSNWEKIRQLVTPNAYAIWSLTGELSLDLSSAGNYGGIFDIHKYEISDEMLEALSIPRTFFPEKIVRSCDVVGEVTDEGARKSGLAKGTPVSAGGIDAPVEALSVGTFQTGEHTATLGTSCCWNIVQERDNAKVSPKLINYPYVADDEKKIYTFGGAVTAAAIVTWFRDQLGKTEQEQANAEGTTAYALLDSAASEVPAGSNGLLVLPYFNGERTPIWDPLAKGTIFGLTLFHTKAHLFRAFLEGVAFSLRANIEAALQVGVQLDKGMKLIGGGAKSRLWRQILADITGFDILYMSKSFGAPLGDVLLAGVGNNLLDYSAITSWLSVEDTIQPNQENRVVYEDLFTIYQRLYENNKLNFADLQATYEKVY